MKDRLRNALVLLLVAGLGGLLLSASGVLPIGAGGGHFEITRAFLEFSKRRSVSTHTLGTEAPPLAAPWHAVKGATHYEVACRSCHGSPERRAPHVVLRMLPVPPDLQRAAPSWDPEHLFYIVKHGIKFTGMPAWPSPHRDDEVWSMTAFLRRLPGLDAQAYRRLASVEPDRPFVAPGLSAGARETIATNCARCHGTDGLGSKTGAFPAIAGQRAAYLAATLEAFARGERHSGIMESAVAHVPPAVLREIADHYAGLAPPPAARPGAGASERGEAIARRGIPERDVPACIACHGPGAAPRNPVYPVLAGQYADYLELQLSLFKEKKRGGTAYAHLMRPVGSGLTAEQMRDVARYFAGLRPAGSTR